MEWLYIYLPTIDLNLFLPNLILLGFFVGILGGYLGVGGGWVVTPCLHILGFPMSYAVGTDIVHIAGKSMFAGFLHAKFCQVDYKLAAVMTIGSVSGVLFGCKALAYLGSNTSADGIARLIYIVFLILIVISTLFETVIQERSQKKDHFIRTLFKSIPPFIHFKASGVSCSLWLPIIPNVFIGFICGFLGIGGGLLRLPFLIYVIRCPTFIAVGTDLVEVCITAFFASFFYFQEGMVEIKAVIPMLVGAILGAYIGVFATKTSHSKELRFCFLFAVFSCLCSILIKQLHQEYYAFLAINLSMIIISIYICFSFLKRRLSF